MRCWLTLLALLTCALAAAADPATWERPGDNLALDKTYTFAPRAGYSLTQDPADNLQLTDGAYTEGYFWTTPTTVGWGAGVNPRVVIDLEQVQPIGGLSYHTAAGRADVNWPREIQVFVSDDGEQWWHAGDLVERSNRREAPPAEGYSLWRYWTDDLPTHGRYVALAIEPEGTFTFVDEIEIYRGDDALLQQARRGTPSQGLDAAILALRAQRDLGVEADAMRERLGAMDLPAERRQALAAAIDRAEDGLADIGGIGGEERAVWPFGDAHRRLWQARAELWRAEGRPPLQAWTGSPHDPLMPGDAPAADATAAIDLAMLGNEHRNAVINVTNATDQDQSLAVSIEGLPGSPQPAGVAVRQTAWTAAKDVRTEAGNGVPATGSALPAAADGVVTVPAGSTGQVWLTFDSGALPAGEHTGRVVLDGAPGGPLTVPLRLDISAIALPDELTLGLGGWDYTNAPHRGVTQENVEEVVAFLREYGVNTPWATSGVMPFGQHDETGAMTAPPSTTAMDSWLELWPDARTYFVFNHVGTPVEDTPAAKRRVAEWIGFWADHLKARGVEPGQLALLLVDETRNPEQDATIVSWARVINEAAPEVMIYNDPIWVDPRQAGQEMLERSDMICPNRTRFMKERPIYEEAYLPHVADDTQFAFYSCDGPVHDLDPYTYHRLQAWDAFRYGATWQGFWAFSDNGGGTSWNEYATPGRNYAPQFLSPEGVTTAKHMEAIREGLYDYEYLVLLRDAVAAAEAAGRNDAAVQRAKALVTDAPLRVLAGPGADQIRWYTAKDRTVADQVRREVIEALEALG